ncbi:hypothetical protein DE146DRAFT_618640, partial [Phaeosphaeria sp. MPI-PUGE-AT-0046c]
LPSGACNPDTITCAATGLNVDFYANDLAYATSFGYNLDIKPDYYIGTTSLASGTSNTLNVPLIDNPGGTFTTIPGGPQYYPNVQGQFAGITYNPNNGTFVFNGYFKPPTTGAYQFCINVDNIDYIYLGSAKAFACGATAPIRAATEDVVTRYVVKCFTATLAQGFLYPFRSVYGMNGLPSYLSTNVTFPGSTTPADLTGTLYPQSCSSRRLL